MLLSIIICNLKLAPTILARILEHDFVGNEWDHTLHADQVRKAGSRLVVKRATAVSGAHIGAVQ